jgi:hypothetical protein
MDFIFHGLAAPADSEHEKRTGRHNSNKSAYPQPPVFDNLPSFSTRKA